MSRRLLAFFSPLKPIRSGIADYSQRLLPKLAQHFDIHLYGHNTPPTDEGLKKLFKWFPRRNYELQKRKTPYDLNIYQVGNSHTNQFVYPVMARYPGAVVIHDGNVHQARAYSHLGHRNLYDYLNELQWCHGSDGERIGPALAHGYGSPYLFDRFPMLKLLCDGARSVFVHNDFTGDRAAQQISRDRIFKIPLAYTDWDLPEYESARNRLNISKTQKIIASFGFITPEKGIDNLVQTYAVFRKQYPESRLVLVGECLDESFRMKLYERISDLDGITITGYVSDNEFKDWLSASDVCVALRYPTQGESSDALLRMMGAGKVVIVPDYRQYRELPDDACLHIPVYPSESYGLLSALRIIMENPDQAKKMATRALNYVRKTHGESTWIKSYVDAIEKTLELDVPVSLGKSSKLRHLRVPDPAETVGISFQNWSDLVENKTVVKVLHQRMKELGLYE